jgi:5-methylcytosine-specific restriction protein A
VRLQRLAPRLATLNTNRVKVLDTKAGATERIRGRAWMDVRKQVMVRDLYTCAGCGLIRKDHEVDHVQPLEQGGDAMSLGNMQLLCSGPEGCHAVKSAKEGRARHGKG